MKKIRNIFYASIAASAFFSCASTAPVTKQPEVKTEEETGFTEETAETEEETERIVAVHNPVPSGKIILIDSFEDGNFWQPLSDLADKDNSTETQTGTQWSSEGETGGVWTFAKTPRGENSVFYCDALSYRKWKGASYLVADINNTTSSSLRVFLTVESDDKTYTSRSTGIGTGENVNVCFNLESALEEAERIKSIRIGVMGRAPAGSIFIDNIRLVK